MAQEDIVEDLMTAIENADFSSVVSTLEHLEQLPERDSHDRSPLLLAIQSRDPKILRAIVDKGANPFVKTKGEDTALHIAARNSSAKMITLLTELGLDPNARNKIANTPLAIAVLGQSADCIKALIRGGADPFYKIQSQTVIESACVESNAESFAAICSELNPNEPRLTEQVPVFCGLACLAESPLLLKILKKYFSSDFEFINTPIDDFSFFVKKLTLLGSHQEYLSRFLQVESPGQYDVPLLAWAVAFGRLEVVKYLIGEGASIDQPIAPNGMTSLMWACIAGHSDIVDLLIVAGADKKFKDQKGRIAEEFIESYGYFFSHRLILKRLRQN